jgi:hypothetical protein
MVVDLGPKPSPKDRARELRGASNANAEMGPDGAVVGPQAGLTGDADRAPMAGTAQTQDGSENGTELEPGKPRRRRADFLDRVPSATPCSFLPSGTIMPPSWASRGQREAVCLWRRGHASWRTGFHVVGWLTASGGIRDRIGCTDVQPISSRRVLTHRVQRAGRKGPIGVMSGSFEAGICCRTPQRFQY